jgi:hypothetical protein
VELGGAANAGPGYPVERQNTRLATSPKPSTPSSQLQRELFDTLDPELQSKPDPATG